MYRTLHSVKRTIFTLIPRQVERDSNHILYQITFFKYIGYTFALARSLP